MGNAYQKIIADVLARWHKIKGEDVWFLTGTDEYGKKVQGSAKEAGKSPKEFVNEVSVKFKQAWKDLNIDYNRFIRTTDKDHHKVVQDIIKKCNENGDIYKGVYEGFYCTECEAYYIERDAPGLICPIHKKPLEKLKEESYFFRLSKYQKFLLELYKKHPEFVLPDKSRKEVTNRVKEGLKDLSISRTSFDWGVPFPLDKKHVTYVWFDALLNYYSATRKKGKEKFWPADVHLIGKDIIWFHCVYWPAMLISAGIKLPKKVFAHGWWTFDKEKISKSLGKVINIDELISIAGVDSARYFLFRETVFGEDGDFSEKALIRRHNNELANKLGNLISRVSALIEKNGCEKNSKYKVPNITTEEKKHFEDLMEKFQFDKALSTIFIYIDAFNKFIQEKKVWEINKKDEKKAILYNLKEGILKIAELLSPFIPESAEKIKKQFSSKKIKKEGILFKKI